MTQPGPAVGAVVAVTDDTYRHHVFTSATPVLVAFLKDADAVCEALRPILSDLALDRAGRLLIVSVDVATNPATTRVWGVTDVPVMVLLHRGVLQRVLRGVRPYARLAQEIDETGLPQSPPPRTGGDLPAEQPTGTPQRSLPELPL